METIIDIYNNLLSYNNNKINYLIDTDENIWFKFQDVNTILEYKSSKDTLRDKISKENKSKYKNIKIINKIKIKQENTIYVNEYGLYELLLSSKMPIAKNFQLWLIKDALPKLRKYGKYELDNKIKKKIDILNNKIKILKKNNTILKNNMTKDKYPNGYHIYIIKDNGLYKIGYTKNLKKRLSTYNTGKANKCYYVYYKKTECAKEIEICMKAFLNRYIYKSNKEFYNCSEKIIINVINKCLKIENNCNKCHEINNNNI
jgi:prophage antirepressor-like protein